VSEGPPRYLLGAAVIFWAAVTERFVPGLVCALLIEGAHWTRVRWAFAEKASLVGWRLSVLFLSMAMALVLLQPGPRITTMARVFTWLPVILIPLQFVQSYGISRTLSLATFSMMIRRRRQHAEEHGLPFRDLRFGFGYAYFCATLLSACLGTNAGAPWYYVGLIVLVGWGISSIVRAGGGSAAGGGIGMATALALALAAVGGYGGQKALTALYRYVTMGHFSQETDPQLNHARERETSIGDLGKLKQSPEIVWRLIPEKGPLPRLLRVASYNTYINTAWRTLIPRDRNNSAKDFEALSELGNPANPADPEDKFQICPPELPDQSAAIDPALPRFRLRGVISDRGGLLPLPADAASLHRFAFEELERNSFGTFMLKPSQPVSDALVLWGKDFETEASPWESIEADGKNRRKSVRADLLIPSNESVILKEVVDEIGLREGTVPEKIERLREHFLSFRYTRYNAVPKDLTRWASGNAERTAWLAKGNRSVLAAFLQLSKAGHCEYFATSAALLLRETGVPTRYVSGFAVVERDPKTREALIRGIHAHAWCRAWDAGAGKWIDVDLTPPDWTGMETPQMSRFQDLQDRIQRWREDLLVWRDQPGHMAIITAVLLAPIIVGMAFVGRNLWRSRQQVAADKKRLRGPLVHAETPLTALEKPARRILGERPPGLPFGAWLLQLSPSMQHPAALADALRIHQRLRFDPGEKSPALLEELRLMVEEIRRQLGSVPRRP